MIIFDANRLRELRRKKHWTQAEAAKRLHCTANSISRWETGKSSISAENLAAAGFIYGDERMQDFFVHTFQEENPHGKTEDCHAGISEAANVIER